MFLAYERNFSSFVFSKTIISVLSDVCSKPIQSLIKHITYSYNMMHITIHHSNIKIGTAVFWQFYNFFFFYKIYLNGSSYSACSACSVCGSYP